MKEDLAAFVAKRAPIDEEHAIWSDGTMPLRIVSYLSDSAPPTDYITSARAIIFRGASVLVLRNMHSAHIMPGGRREADESLEQTLHREVLEEAGWTITRPNLLGFRRLRHLAPKPPEYLYPYPDFAWIIYTAEAVDNRPDARIADDYEVDASWRLVDELQTLDLTRAELEYLDAALKRRKQGQ